MLCTKRLEMKSKLNRSRLLSMLLRVLVGRLWLKSKIELMRTDWG